MACDTARDRLLELAQGHDLPDIAAHAAACEQCGPELARLQRVVALVGELPSPEPSPEAAAAVMDFVQVSAALDRLPDPQPSDSFTSDVLAFAQVSDLLDRLPEPQPSPGFAARVVAAAQRADRADETTAVEAPRVTRLSDYLGDRVRKAPVWAGVLAAHAAALLVFATIAIGTRSDTRTNYFVDPTSAVDQAGIEPDKDPLVPEGFKPPVPEVPKTIDIRDEFVDEPRDDDHGDRPDTTPVRPDPRPVAGPPGNLSQPVDRYMEKERQIRTQVAAWFGSRLSSEQRAAAAAAAGTTGWNTTVERGLAWLRAHQQADGSWDAQKHGGTAEHRVGLTAMAVLAFAAEGRSPGSGSDDSRRLLAAAEWMVERQDQRSGRYGADVSNHMYNHGIAMLALGELHALDLANYWSIKQNTVRDSLRKAIGYLAVAQNDDGGWGYRPGARSDTSITVWQIAALKTAQVLGIKERGGDPAKMLLKAETWLASVGDDLGRFGYHGKQDFPKGAPALAAAGAWARFLTGKGWDANAEDSGIALLAKNRPGKRGAADHYGWYYGALVMHRRGGAAWTTYRDGLGAALTARQQTDGSWLADDDYGIGQAGGRLYATAMSLLALQSPHRYLTK